MKTLIFFLLMVDIAFAGQIGDMNADGMIGLEEAIISLQVVSGTTPAFGCSPGQNFCLDSTIRAECSETGSQYTFMEDCSGTLGQECNPESGECYACVPSQKYCISTDYEGTCNSAGTGNSGFRNCQLIYGYGCLEATGECNACVPNQKYCISADYEGTCNSAGTGNSGFRNCQLIYGTECDSNTGRCIEN
ncbi:MAG: hypothetical protein GY702_24155 [Desulfobulbaceae bacterium]|nr:hypothetical protein [Desulfobulbaceae bacterium]